MKIWLTRHGQTDLNKKKLMQGRIDEPLNEVGRQQARDAHTRLMEEYGQVKFDAIYASPLDRAIETASLIADVDRKEIIIDDRIIETDFGSYDCKSYYLMGPAMTAYWALPEIFKAPKSVESTASMVARSQDFLADIKEKHASDNNILIVCHGGIIRALTGCLEGAPRGYKWRPKPHNCEMRIFEL